MRSIRFEFSKDNRGSIAIIFAFALAVIVGAVGGAVDFGRYMSAKRQTAAALDAAVLAGARVLLLGGSQQDAKNTAQQYYDRNVANRFSVSSDTVQFLVQQGGKAVVAQGKADLSTTFLKVLGIDTLPLVDSPGVNFTSAEISSGGGSNIEVSLMLDLTGSMCPDGNGPCTSGPKLDALKAAATDLVNIVVSNDQSTYKSRVALVPFTYAVRVATDGQGSAMMAALTGLPATWSGYQTVCTNWTQTSAPTGAEGAGGSWTCNNSQVQQVSNWKIRPCVTERFYDNGWIMGLTDSRPGNGMWLNAITGRRWPIANDSATASVTAPLGLTSSDPANEYNNYNEWGSCWGPQSNVIEPLSSDKTALVAKINGFQAEGQTAGALGTAFAWYMLSPEWDTIWPNASKPDPYAHLSITQSNGKPKLRKVAVLMSDGVFNTYRGWSGQDQQEVSNYAKQLCANMKAKGIEIYAVGFDLDALPAAQKAIAIDTLQSCGTDLSHFYNTLNPAELQGAFRDIGVQLSSIRLVR
ncbi:MAG: hypothetical protein KDJ36_13310 [Hyphomicrobiaceae bacterium]|nr:hypothetical protein [Hyphomicrobiaceae bacterium]